MAEIKLCFNEHTGDPFLMMKYQQNGEVPELVMKRFIDLARKRGVFVGEGEGGSIEYTSVKLYLNETDTGTEREVSQAGNASEAG